MSWEERMATRAHERKVVHESAEQSRWRRGLIKAEQREVARRANMTLGQGIELLNAAPWACACVGPPLCCRYAFIQARALQRGAHIVVKLLADSLQDHAD